MAGYMIYSLDWDKFQRFLNSPTDKQLAAFTNWISEGLGDGGDDDEEIDDEIDDEDDEIDDEDDDEEEDDFEAREPVCDWPTEPAALRAAVKERLTRPDWYGDLSDGGKQIWETAVNYFCSEESNGVGFRVDHDGVYWTLLDIACKQLNVPPNQISSAVALSAFGQRPYRYHPSASGGGSPYDEDDDDFDAWHPTHSMHTPDEVRQVLEEFQSVAPAIAISKKKDAINDYDSLMPVLEKLAKEKRMLFVQVDT